MVVDIIDLELETLQLNKRYDINRYRRGEKLFNEGNVQIEKVVLDKDNNYKVQADVEGNYDYYTTNIEIYNNEVQKCSCTCEDFYKGNLCKHILATYMEIKEPHYASTPDGRKRLEERRIEEKRKILEEIKERQKQELQRREYERRYYSSINILEKYKKDYNENSESNLNLEEIYEEMLESKNLKANNLATSIKIEPYLEICDEKTLRISFKIGQTRMYVLNSISDFYEAYRNETEIYFGKQLCFIPKRENFINESQELFDFIIKYAEMVEYNNRYSRYGLDSNFNKTIHIAGDKIDDFLDIIKNDIISLNRYDGNFKYQFTDDKLDIRCTLSKEKVAIPKLKLWYGSWFDDYDECEESEEYVFKLNISDYNILQSNNKIYVFYMSKIYVLNKDKNNVELFKLFENEDEILIPEDKLEEFERFVCTKIQYFDNEKLPKKISEKVLVVSKLASKMLLDTDDEGNILLELKFCYMDSEFNVLEDEYEMSNNMKEIVRDIPAEKEVIKRLFVDGFKLISGRKEFVMSNENDIYAFLSYKIEGYMNDFEVLATDKFKNKQIKKPKITNVGIRVDNGLLELDISKINVDMDEIKDILKDYKIKKKYHKLKNGDFLDLTENKELNLLDEMATTLDIDYGNIKEGKINLPINRSFYLEKLMDSNHDFTVAKNEQYTELIENLENNEISDNLELDDEFEKKLRDYQKVGYKWLKTLETHKFGGILADDMGLGKTLQIIALLHSQLKTKNRVTSIVVCPSTLVLNWKAEIEKWCSNMNVLIIKGTAEERNDLLNQYKNYDLVITSYDLLKRDIENYENKNFKYIIADEAQYIKNASTQNATSLKSLNGEIKFALTGTPIENSIAELWSIFDFIMPGYLYNYNKFKKKFEEPILKLEDKEVLERLKRLISPFILRRVKKDVLTELPEKNITIMKNEMEKEQEKIYLSYLAQTRKEVAEDLEKNSFEKSKFKILMLLTRLRQICCHPGLFIENYNGNSGKLRQCLDLVVDAIASGHKILIFSSYTSMFEILEKELKKINVEYFKLVGNTPVGQRIEMVDEFNNSSSVKVFLISLKAGGTGLNLTSADAVIHYDPWWNVSSENQATDRAYRIGQKNSVQVYKLITSNSIEEKINKMQERKEKLSKDILSTEETFISQMSKKEILDLFE